MKGLSGTVEPCSLQASCHCRLRGRILNGRPGCILLCWRSFLQGILSAFSSMLSFWFALISSRVSSLSSMSLLIPRLSSHLACRGVLIAHCVEANSGGKSFLPAKCAGMATSCTMNASQPASLHCSMRSNASDSSLSKRIVFTVT